MAVVRKLRLTLNQQLGGMDCQAADWFHADLWTCLYLDFIYCLLASIMVPAVYFGSCRPCILLVLDSRYTDLKAGSASNPSLERDFHIAC